MERTVLQMRGIRKEFPGVIALEDVDFDLKRGEVHVLFGENGAGKSTLIKIISGALEKTRGTIHINGQITPIQNPKHALQLGICTIYQELNLVPELTVAENIFLGREPASRSGWIDNKNMNEKTAQILSNLGVDIDPELKISGLSIAMRQMAEISKAISMDCRILILDEPTSALTWQEIKHLFKIIEKLKEENVAIIYISHRIEEIFEIGDRVTVLRDGKVVGTRNIEDTQQSELIQMMVNRELKEFYPPRSVEIGKESLRVEGLSQKGKLDDINFSSHRGEILGLTGLMGSGRTELAMALFGVDPIDGGTIYLNGEACKIDSARKAMQLGLGYVPEDRQLQGLVLKLSLAKNISLTDLEQVSSKGLINFQAEHKQAQKAIQNLHIKTTGPDQKVRFLSGGNQQKVVIGKWLACQTDIFLLDEPTRGIDVAAKVEIYQLINSLAARGATIVLISSELPEVIGMCDRIIVMREGRINGIFDSSTVTQEILLKCELGVE